MFTEDNKIYLDVPPGIKYMSEWKDYVIPYGRCIVDKGVCGCGYTQLCLTNEDDIILCSPRKSLLENKLEQNVGCHYFQPVTLSSKEKRQLKLDTKEKVQEYCLKFQSFLLKDYLDKCEQKGSPLKLLVTYDSLPRLIENLIFYEVDLFKIKTIVDEFQLVFSDARFKADTELDFINYLTKKCKNVVYLSGTPMLDSYLNIVSEFDGLNYYVLRWNDDILSRVEISKIKTSNLEKSAVELINLYLEGLGPTKIVNGEEVRSKEAVLYVNNVSMVTSIVKTAKLTPDQVNIITAKTPENLRKIKKCGKDFNFGRIPLKGEKHKLITLCTSTAFCGVDMYSETAKSYIFSSCSLKTMAVDISIELPQIVGRQRLESNPFRRDVTLFYTEYVKEFSEKDFMEYVESKKMRTKSQREVYELVKKEKSEDIVNSHRRDIREWIIGNNYKDSYTSILRDSGDFTFNSLMFAADLRSWELQNRIYSNEKEIVRVLENSGKIVESLDTTTKEKNIEEMVSNSNFEDRLRFLVSYVLEFPDRFNSIPESYRKYFIFTPEELESSNYRKDVLDKKLKRLSLKERVLSNSEFINLVLGYFELNKVYSRKEIKAALESFCMKLGLSVNSDFKLTASDILRYFKASPTTFMDSGSGKVSSGYRITSMV
jgi:hypothetical protein